MSFKQRDIRPCACCGKGLAATGLPLFYRLTIERFGLDGRAIQRQAGLEAMMGGNALIAAAMGPDEDLAVNLAGPRTVLVCETCSHQAGRLFPVLVGDEERTDG